jgi:putative oxidoreductase
MDWVLLLGRILFAAIFVWSGIGFHIAGRQQGIAYAAAKGAPAPELTVPLTGVAIILAGVMFVLGLWVDLAALVIFVFLVLTAVIMHAFWKVGDAEERMLEQVQFTKDLALAGGALGFFYLFQQFGEAIGITIEPALFD